jgi:hypothetical protein
MQFNNEVLYTLKTSKTPIGLVKTRSFKMPQDVYSKYMRPKLNKLSAGLSATSPRNVTKHKLTSIHSLEQAIDPACLEVIKRNKIGVELKITAVCTNERVALFRYAPSSQSLTLAFYCMYTNLKGLPVLKI